MEEVCQKCGLPKNLCVCAEIAKESQKIKVRVDNRRFGKTVTTVSGLSDASTLDELFREFKRRFACGGTIKNGVIELQGNHRSKVKAVLLKRGFKEELIDA